MIWHRQWSHYKILHLVVRIVGYHAVWLKIFSPTFTLDSVEMSSQHFELNNIACVLQSCNDLTLWLWLKSSTDAYL
jgi:hypothetical protein